MGCVVETYTPERKIEIESTCNKETKPGLGNSVEAREAEENWEAEVEVEAQESWKASTDAEA